MLLRQKIFHMILLALPLSFFIAGCKKEERQEAAKPRLQKSAEVARMAVNFNHQLDEYEPKKKSYKFYFTYKLIHPWWDAVAIGVEDAVRQFEQDRGIIIEYDYIGLDSVSPKKQAERIEAVTRSGDYDVLAVDVADTRIVTSAINRSMESGQKVMTFSSSDLGKENGCKRQLSRNKPPYLR